MAVVPTTHERDVRTPTLVIATVIAATMVLALRSPHEGGYGMCWVLALTGYQCPTCGGLRAVHDLAHLDIAGAWAMNPLLTIALPIIGILMIGWWWRARRGYRPLTLPVPWAIAMAVLVIGYGIVRNL